MPSRPPRKQLPRNLLKNDWAKCILPHRVIPRRKSSSIAPCCISTRSGTAHRRRTFEEVLKEDPQCAIAYWGIALSYLYNPHAPPPAESLPLGLDAVKKGQALGAKTQRERDYIDAIAAMYVDYDKLDHRTRVQNYLKAEEQVAARYPDDDEAQIAYAITLECRRLAG